MNLPGLLPGILLRRYKRFLADIRLEDGATVTAFCPNTGSMLGCSEPGRTVYLSRSRNPLRKYPLTWELISMPDALVGVNTWRTNAIVAEALQSGRITELARFTSMKREVVTSPGVRLDFGLSVPDCDDVRSRCFLEVKNCSLVRKGIAAFPDAVTMRGRKHLLELIRLAEEGHAAAILFCVQRADGRLFSPAEDIDPEYALLLRRAADAGVLVLARFAHVDPTQVTLAAPLPVLL